MAKKANNLDAIAQQNELLKEQNELLREQNELLRQSTSTNSGGGCFVDDIDHDEMRSGFLVTSHRKKLWNVQIGLIQEFARICKKHNLRWFAIGGTLIGAARHGGFIPWDDDVDVLMFRPDYSKFQEVAMQEVKSPYFLDVWCNYKLESEATVSEHDEVEGLQFVTLDEEQMPDGTGWVIEWPKMKLRDNRTCQILRPSLSTVNQGIWIDIFPLDPAPPFLDGAQEQIFEVAKELHIIAMYPEWIRYAMDNNFPFLLSYEDIKKMSAESLYSRGTLLDNFMKENFFNSPKVARTVEQFLQKKEITYTTSDFDNVVYLPFEKITLPAPANYDSVLTACYGDWRKLIRYPAHILDYSVDFSSKEYFKALSSKSSVSVKNKFSFRD